MKYRPAVIFTGQGFQVPQGIQRIDTRSTHGWQVRCDGTKMFSDHSSDGSGAEAALALATAELAHRLALRPAPPALQQGPSAHKTSKLPSGISGPVLRRRSDGRRSSYTVFAEFSLHLPRFGQTPRHRTVYIGNASSYSPQRYNEMLAKAVALREQAMVDYQRAATLHRRERAFWLLKGGEEGSAVGGTKYLAS